MKLRRLLLGLLIVVLLLLAGLLLAARAGAFAGRPPADAGLREGRLRPPSPTPNSVSSRADDWPDHPQRAYARIAPLRVAGDPAQALDRLAAAIEAMGGRVVERRGDSLRAEFTTRWLRFVDDADFVLDRDRGVIDLRSASRLGRRDFGANRARIEALRARLQAAP